MRTYRMLFAVMMGALIAACGEAQLAEHPGPAEDLLGSSECPFPTNREVCGVDGKTRAECEATRAGMKIAHQGRCSASEHCSWDAVFDPVCGIDNETYENSGHAACLGVDVAHAGECMECGWSSVPELVCGEDGRTYLNAEQATCLGVGIRYEGSCEACMIPQVDAPVCGVDGKTYMNSFAAACYDVEVLFEGRCEGWVCTADWSPVCGEDGRTHSNECVAVRQNHTRVAHIGACGCECDDVYEPVCVGVIGEGTYPNACMAACAGLTITHEGPCEDVTASG